MPRVEGDEHIEQEQRFELLDEVTSEPETKTLRSATPHEKHRIDISQSP
jgi:hypothetical protein